MKKTLKGMWYRGADSSGRSMVEMLGVLAVIGLLSAVAVGGYRVAITKHRANGLMNGLMKRAVVVAGQLTLQKTEPSLSEFSGDSSEFGTFDTTIGQNSVRTQFVLSITGMDSDICTRVKELAETDKVIRDVSGNCSGTANTLKFTYNNDMNSEDSSDTTDGAACEATCAAPNRCLINGES